MSIENQYEREIKHLEDELDSGAISNEEFCNLQNQINREFQQALHEQECGCFR